jgi:hypothetical protein
VHAPARATRALKIRVTHPNFLEEEHGSQATPHRSDYLPQQDSPPSPRFPNLERSFDDVGESL